MLLTYVTRQFPFSRAAKRFPGGVALVAIAFLLAACGGGGAEMAPSGGDGSGGSSTGNTAVLTWDAVSAANLAGYRIYYGIAPGTYLQSSGQGLDAKNSTTYTVTGLSSGTRYYFAATAYDTSNIESGYSNEVFKDMP
jgi:hypothetical protein